MKRGMKKKFNFIWTYLKEVRRYYSSLILKDNFSGPQCTVDPIAPGPEKIIAEAACCAGLVYFNMLFLHFVGGTEESYEIPEPNS
jgi:hypothetical protein